MPKEQEVIKRLNFHKEYARLSSNRVVISETDLETVLNTLKEKDKEIKTLTQTNKSYKGMIKKKDKIIDLMAEFIFQNIDVEEEICNSAYIECKQETAQDITCINCIKQYFERKSEEC